MNGKEALALITIPAALGITAGSEISAHVMDSSRAAAITAQTCQNTFDNRTTGNITQQTLNCMSKGWVPEGRSLDVSQFHSGDASGLLKGYIEIELNRANHFNVSQPLLFGFVGAGLGIYLLLADEDAEKKKKSKAKLPKATEQGEG